LADYLGDNKDGKTAYVSARNTQCLPRSPSINRMIKSRRMRCAGHVARMGANNACRILVGKPEVKRPLGRPGCRREDNIRMDLREIGCGVMDWIDLVQDRDQWRALVNTVMNLRVS
jgi:hypothetical protein